MMVKDSKWWLIVDNQMDKFDHDLTSRNSLEQRLGFRELSPVLQYGFVWKPGCQLKGIVLTLMGNTHHLGNQKKGICRKFLSEPLKLIQENGQYSYSDTPISRFND